MSKDEPRAVFEASIADGLSDSEVPDEIRRLAAWTENR